MNYNFLIFLQILTLVTFQLDSALDHHYRRFLKGSPFDLLPQLPLVFRVEVNTRKVLQCYSTAFVITLRLRILFSLDLPLLADLRKICYHKSELG